MGIAQQQCKANVDLVSDNVRALGSRLSIETERVGGVLWVGPAGCYRVYKGGVLSSSYDAVRATRL